MVGKNNYSTETCYRMDTLYSPHRIQLKELQWKRQNLLVVMTEDGHTISLDELNEFLMEWNKSSVVSPNFTKVCTQTRYVITSCACAFDTFGNRNRRTMKPSKENDVTKLMDLVEKGKLYRPPVNGKKQEMPNNFWWDLVQPSNEKVGSAKAIGKQTVADPENVRHLFGVPCSSEKTRDLDEFELDKTGDGDVCVSVVSGMLGGPGSGVILTFGEDNIEPPEWEILNKEDRETNISRNLKKFNDIKKRLMSKYILKDMLGDDGTHAILNIEKAHKKLSRKERMKINDIYRAVKYFNQMLGKRRQLLKTNFQKSKERTYAKPHYACRETYDRMMAQKRSGAAVNY